MYQDLIYRLFSLQKFIKPEGLVFSGSLEPSGIENSCRDILDIQVTKVVPIIEGIFFSHHGCVLSRAVFNALCLEIEKKTLKNAISIIEEFLEMIENNKNNCVLLGENLCIFKRFRDFLSRRACLIEGAKKLRTILLSFKEDDLT